MFSGIMTAILLTMFVALWLWSWSSKRQSTFEEMSRLPLEEDSIKDINEESL